MEINLRRGSRVRGKSLAARPLRIVWIKMRASINEAKIIITSDTVNNGFPVYFRRLKTQKVFGSQRLPLACYEAVII